MLIPIRDQHTMHIVIPSPVEELAQELIDGGYLFRCERVDGDVYLFCDDASGQNIAREKTVNTATDVPLAMEWLVKAAHRSMCRDLNAS